MKFVVLYDGQCEVCQACISWLVALDKHHVAAGLPLEDADLERIHPDLTLNACLEELHIIAANGTIYRGWRAIAELAKISRWTWLIGFLGSYPPMSWLGNVAYRWIAGNRYLLSKCRGGACHSVKVGSPPDTETFLPFWSCYLFGLLIRAPLSFWHGALDIKRNFTDWAATFRRRVDLLSDTLTVMFLGGLEPEVVPLLFGERFCAILYRGVLFDPGSPKMRRSLFKHLSRLAPDSVKHVVATHHHEEHVGNLETCARHFGVPIYASALTAAILQNYPQLPWSRTFAIGQPADLAMDVELLIDGATVGATGLVAYESPGHCADHMVFYEPTDKVLIAGDAFMGSYFATPNPDVDSRKWIDSLRRLLDLDIEVLIEGHGHIHTLRSDFPDVRGVVVRDDPKQVLQAKLDYLYWIRTQIDEGVDEGLPARAIEATCFPWTSRRVWECFGNETLIGLLSGGHFSHAELIRSFARTSGDAEMLPIERRLKVYS